MASTITQLINNNFGGIRRKDAFFSQEKITCSDCQNVELFFTKLNSGVGIRTAKGNIPVTATIGKIPLDVYKRVSREMTEIATDGDVEGRTLVYSTTVDETTVYYSYKRSPKDDLEVYSDNAITQYFAFKNKDDIVYTLYERNEIQTTSIFSDNEEVIDIFECYQNNILNVYAYVENNDSQNSSATIYKLNLETGTKTAKVTGLSVTGKVCATSYITASLDVFVLSNGKELVYIKINSDSSSVDYGQEEINVHSKTSSPLYDVEWEETQTEDHIVAGLGIVMFDNRLWVFNGRTLWFSDQTNREKFNKGTESYITDAGLIYEVKDITAIYPYLGSLAVFFKDSSILVEVEGSSPESKFKQSDESPGGCAGYKSLVFHGTDLFFYDDTKKGVFSFKQIVLGDKTLGENVAVDIQDELIKIKANKLNEIKALSVVTNDRNEVWFLVPISEDSDYSIIMIFDYVRGEWVKRKCQHINGMNVINSELYSVGKDVYKEYKGNTFSGIFIQAYYTCSMFNLGADNTMKITKFPPRLTVDGSDVSNFFVKYIKNYNFVKTPKTKEIRSKNNSNVLIYDSEDDNNGRYDKTAIYIPNTINAIVKIPSATFKSLEITFYITDEEQSFAIKSIEFSKIKVKQV